VRNFVGIAANNYFKSGFFLGKKRRTVLRDRLMTEEDTGINLNLQKLLVTFREIKTLLISIQ
jgi:hypothetical protein